MSSGERKSYLDSPEDWDKLAALLRQRGVFGLDTEFSNVDVGKQSCVGRAQIHVWSVAVRTSRLSPLGFSLCRGWCLPVEALTHPSIRAVLEDPSIFKDIHNRPVDEHAMNNHGVDLRGARNTLDLVRWYLPWLVNTPGRFKAKALMWSLLRRQPVCTYKQLVAYKRPVQVEKQRKVKISSCSCGIEGCRLRKAREEDGVLIRHEKSTTESVETYAVEKLIDDEYPLESIVPGHERWELLVRYAIDDAVAAEQFADIVEQQKDPAPWPYSHPESPTGRPRYNQRIEDEIVAMEKVGIPIDVEFCRVTAAQAEADEEKELRWLYRWFVLNAPTEGPWKRATKVDPKTGKVKGGVDSIWSSPAKKLRLFDALRFPRSPIWKKGRVKDGEAKMDETAMEWIGKNCDGAKRLTDHLRQLQKIRNNKKYLIKMRDSGGMVHPICGPAGDEDDRAGAVTGRLAIKGEVETQQLPSREEKDIYQVRKAIVACG